MTAKADETPTLKRQRAEQAQDLLSVRAHLASMPENEAKRAIESEYVLRLVLKGWSYRAAARALDLSPATAHRRVQAALAARLDPLVSQHRALAGARLDEMTRTLALVIDSNIATHADRVAAVRAWVAVEQRRAALFGTDAPIQANLNVKTEQADAEDALQAMIAAEKEIIRREQTAGRAAIEGGNP